MTRSQTRSAPLRSTFGRLGISLVLFGAMSLAQACATGGHGIRGTVTVIDSTRIEVRHKSGQRVSVGLSPRTSFRRGDTGATFNDVRVGGRVIVVPDEGVSPFTASEVRIFSQACASSHPPVFRPQLPPAGGSTTRAHREQ